MKSLYLAIAMVALSMSAPSQAAQQDARSYCESAAKVMQLEGEKAAAYIEQCIKAKQEEESEE